MYKANKGVVVVVEKIASRSHKNETVKPWSNGPASGRKWAQVELA